MFVYIVTHYGRNSTPDDIFTPTTSMFTNFDEAYEHFMLISQRITLALSRKEEGASQYINTAYNPHDPKLEYIVIEDRQLCNKRATGVVIARCGL
jgi:hypothetical protein